MSASLLFAQLKMPEMPAMTNISDGPSMPRVSAPVLGSTFYIPGNIYNRAKKEVSIKNTEESDTLSSIKTSNSSITNDVLLTALQKKTLSRITASDVSDMETNGLFGGIYGLLDKETKSSNDLMLQQIMQELEGLKTQNEMLQKQISLGKKNLPVQKVYNNKDITDKAKILRFIVNGNNLLDSCRTVYFSQKEIDGSFLLTGDRKYSSDNKSRDETFYLLFKADGNCGTCAGYDVEPKLVQDYKNENSFLYRLSKKHNLKAEKTGNLVALRCTDSDYNMDLLLDIGSK